MLEEADGGSSGPRYAPHAGRAPAARQRWMQVYRNVLRDEDIDTLLTANVSVRALGEPLLLGRDVDLLALVPRGTDKKPEKGKYSSRGGAETRRMASLFPKAGAPAGASGNDHAYVNGFPVNPALRAVDLTRLHQAFTDGFELVVHDMHMRSLATHDLVDALEAFWTVPVDSSLHFFPTRASTPEPDFRAEDAIILQLDGELDVRVFDNAYAAPMPEHVATSTTRNSVLSSLASRTPRSYRLYEGDTLYIPRGCAFDTHTDRKISMHLTIAVKSHECTAREAILAVIDAADAMDDDVPNPLRDPLNQTASVCGATYATLLRTAVHVAAELTPDLRTVFPVGKAILFAIDEADGFGAEQRMTKYVDDFTVAARDALFAPLLDVLVSEDNFFTSSVGPGLDDIVIWARDISVRRDHNLLDRAERMFRYCIQYVRKHMKEVIAEANMRLRSDRETSMEQSRKVRLVVAESSLAGHGEPVSFIPPLMSGQDPLSEKFLDSNQTKGDICGGISNAPAAVPDAAQGEERDVIESFEAQCWPQDLLRRF
jgi:hypothetical protein